MPRAFDLRTPEMDHSPLANLLDFSGIDQTAELAGSLVKGYIDSLLDGVVTIIYDLTGLDLQALADVLHGLDFSSPEAFLGSLIAAIVALPDTLLILLNSLIEMLLTVPEQLANLATGLINSGAGLLGIESPLNSLNLYNLVPTDLLGQLSFSNIGDTLTNLIADPLFQSVESFTGLDTWFHDAAAGHIGGGSAQTFADGTLKELLGNLIPVSAGQVLNLSGWAKWTGLAGTGTPIALAVTGYDASGSVVNQATVASHNTTPPTTDWLNLAGTYTVPAGVASIRQRLSVGSSATAGTVWWDDMTATKTQTMLQRFVAGTDPGQILTDDIGNLFGGIMTNAAELLEKAGLADFNTLVSTVAGDFGDDIAAAEARLNDFLHSLSPLNGSNISSGTISDARIPTIPEIRDAVVTAVGNLGGSGFDLTKMLEVLTGQTHAVVDASAGVVNMFARLSNLESKVSALPVASGGTGAGRAAGGAVGVVDIDNMERVSGTSLGPLWLTSYQGGAGVWATPNGHDATFATSGVASREFLCIRNNAAVPRSETDYQRVTLELSSKATRYYDILLGAWNYCGFNDIWLRISEDTTSLANITGIRIRWGGDGGLYIHRFIGGVGTQLAGVGVGGIPTPGPGANLVGEAGVLADGATRAFRAKIGASIRLAITETGTASGLGATCRRWGHGGLAEGHVLPLPGQERPGGTHYWTGADQTL